MFKWIKNYFALPEFEDDEQTRRARLLISILAPLAVVTVVMVGIMVAINGMPDRLADASPIIVAVLIVIATLLSFPLVRRRFPSELAIIILTLIVGVTTIWLWFTDGLSGGYASYTYVLAIVLAGLLLGPRGAVVYTFLSLIGIVGAAYAENRGLIPGRTGVDLVNVLILATVVALTGVFLRYAMKSMQDAIHRARLAAQAQTEANRELQAIRRSLEERVAARTQDLQSRSTLLLTAIELGRAAASLRDLDELLSLIPEMIAEQTSFYHAGLFLVDEYRESVVLRGTNSPEGQQLMVQHYRVALDAPTDLLGVAAAKREPRVAMDVGPDAVAFVASPFPRTRSQLALPLIAGNRLVGALDLHSTESDVLTDQMIEVMRLLADQLAIAIESAQLFAQSQAALAAEQRAYGTVSRDAWREMTRAEGVEGGLRFLSDAPGVIRPATGEKPAVMQQARQTGRSVVTPTLTEADSTLAVPIQIREGVSIGALRLNKATWGEDEIALVETLTEQLGAALESARLYQETQRREARERITREITEDIRRSVDMEVILKTAVSNLGDALGVPRTYVRLMLGEESPGEESPDVDTLIAAPVEETGDSPETSADTPDASIVDGDGRNFAGGEEHDEP